MEFSKKLMKIKIYTDFFDSMRTEKLFPVESDKGFISDVRVDMKFCTFYILIEVNVKVISVEWKSIK